MKEEIRNIISDTMKEKATDILTAATTNADKIVEDKLREQTNNLRDDFDDQISTKTKSEHAFKSNVNKSNFDFTKQIDDIWRKTERAIDDKDMVKYFCGFLFVSHPCNTIILLRISSL